MILVVMIIQNNFHSIHMDHLVRIVIVTNPRLHLHVDHIIDRIVITHILNNVDEDERRVVVQHLHPVRVLLLLHQLHPIPVQHRDPIRDHRRLHPDQVIHLIIVILEDEQVILEQNHRRIKMMMKIIVQV